MPIQVKKVQLKLKDGQEYKDGDLLFNVDAQAWATGKRNRVDVASTDQTYQNNAAYYAQQAHDSADAAAVAALEGNLATIFDSTESYSIGDYVIYDGKLYRFKVDHAAGVWNAAQVDQKKVDEVLKEFKDQIDDYIVINEEATDNTKIQIETTDEDIDLALSSQLNAVANTVTNVKQSLETFLQTGKTNPNFNFILGYSTTTQIGQTLDLVETNIGRYSMDPISRLPLGDYIFTTTNNYRVQILIINSNGVIIATPTNGLVKGEFRYTASQSVYTFITYAAPTDSSSYTKQNVLDNINCVYIPMAVTTDKTLTLVDKAADAKSTGEMITIDDNSGEGTKINITTSDEDIEIPTMDDVEGLIEDVDNLKTQSDAISSSVFHDQYVVPIFWENGSISSGTTEVDDSQRKRSAEFMNFWNAPQIDITVPTGKRIITFVYSAPSLSAFESTITWKSADFSIVPNGKYYRFTISNDPEGEARVSEAGFIFSGTTYAEIINDVTNEKVNNLISIGNNLLNPDECVDKITISTAGVVSTNSLYWATGFIDVSPFSKILLPTARVLREVFYDATKETAVGYIGGAKNPVNIPAGAKYMRVVFYKNDVDYDNRETLSIIPYGTNAAFESYYAFNDAKTLHDNQYFYINAGTYTESFTIHAKRGNQGNKNMIVAFKGYYSGTTAPTIQFYMKNAYSDTVRKYFTSQVYVLGNDTCTDNKEWRVPAFPPQAMDFEAVITIPAGTELYLEYLYNRFDDAINRNCQGYILEAHLGTLSIYPQNTMLSFHSAAKLGYPACVAVPKRTSDGVWVCFHDDANVGGLLRYPDGSALSTEDAAKRISDFTYTELLAFSAGARVDMFYAGEKVPKLSEFFSLCQKTGMHPVLSIHPIPTESEWIEIKALAKKYNVLQTLAVKIPSVNSVGDAYNVLGDDIEFYIYENGTNNDNTTLLIALGLNLNHAKLCTEYSDTYIDQTKVTNGLNNGLMMGCYLSFGIAARYKELMDMGVTFITDDNNNSYGLNW